MAIPRYKPHSGAAILSAGFRPFFLAAALWAAAAVPLWLALYSGHAAVMPALPPLAWHIHEMLFGFAAATVAGFMLTAIPNWTGRLPLQGRPLALLVACWAAGRVACLLPALDAGIVALLDLSFPALFLAIVAREILAGRNWRNLPMIAALLLLLIGNLMVHLESSGVVEARGVGNRLGLATLLLLIALVGGRIVPSFTRNWLAKQRPELSPPAAFDWLDRLALGVTAAALALWVAAPQAAPTAWAALAAGLLLAARLLRWRGEASVAEPLLAVLHLGYGWLALGLVLLAAARLPPRLPEAAALHALGIGAVGTMTLAVMTRASLGHTGRPLTAGPGTVAIYGLVSLAAVLRIAAPLAGAGALALLIAAAAAWSGAFALFALLYGPILAAPRPAPAA